MKRLLLMLLIGQTTHAQITGKLLKTGGVPLPGVNVLLLKSPDTSRVAEVLTDSMGVYTFAAPTENTYIVRAISLEYEAWESKPFHAPKNLGSQVLHERTKQLAEVVVRAEKPPFTQNAYGITVNPESSLLTAGSTVLDVLQRSPGVVLDPQHGGISLNGKSDITVMINGRLTHLSLDQLILLLGSMNADNLEKIDLMPTPPANYDAGGSGGIINIVLKKGGRKGDTGSFTLSGGSGWGEKAAASARFDHHTGKVDLFGSLSVYNSHTRSLLDAWGSETEPLLGGACDFTYHADTRNIINSEVLNLGLEVQADARTTIGAGLLYDVSNNNSISDNRAVYDVFPDSLLSFNGQITGDSRYRNPEASVYVERTFHKGECLNLDLDGIDYFSSSPTAVQSTFLDSKGVQYQAGDTAFAPIQNGYYTSEIKVGVIKLDYTRSLRKNLDLEAGLKGDYTHSLSNAGILSDFNGTWVPRGGTTSDILMREYIEAGYLSLHAHFDSTTTLTAGLRYETSRTRASDSVDLPIRAFFPDIFLVRGHWALSYTNRISRPSYSDLTSFISYNDPISVQTGNPFLRPTLTHNIKLGYNDKGYGISLLFSRDNYPIARWQVVARPGSELVYICPENLPYENTVQLEGLAAFTIRSWWKLRLDASGYYRQYRVDYVPEPFTKAYLTWAMNATSSWTLPAHWSAELSGYFNALTYRATATNYSGGQLNVGLRKDMVHSGSLQLSVVDPFRLLHYAGFIGDLTEDAFDSRVHTDYQPESRIFPIIRLTYRRSFGSEGHAKTPRSSLDEERSRL
jgi:iron complex outermembrane receptor protein